MCVKVDPKEPLPCHLIGLPHLRQSSHCHDLNLVRPTLFCVRCCDLVCCVRPPSCPVARTARVDGITHASALCFFAFFSQSVQSSALFAFTFFAPSSHAPTFSLFASTLRNHASHSCLASHAECTSPPRVHTDIWVPLLPPIGKKNPPVHWLHCRIVTLIYTLVLLLGYTHTLLQYAIFASTESSTVVVACIVPCVHCFPSRSPNPLGSEQVC